MADLIIKDMEMPNSCFSCRIRKREGMTMLCPILNRTFSAADSNLLYHRLKDCPLRPAPEWISVEARLPKAEDWYLTFNEASPSGFSNVDKWIPGRWIIAESNMGRVTHWRPLPEPPEGGGSSG